MAKRTRTLLARPEARSAEARYWPVFDRASGRIRGVELAAAIGTDGPGDDLFEAVATELAGGIAAELGWWVSVRLDGRRVAWPGTPYVVADVLRRSGLHPARLVLVADEADLAEGVRAGSVAALAALGVRFAVADFGSGALRPQQLRHIPVACLRLSLTGLIPSDGADVALLRSVVAGAEALEMEVLAADVETDDQVALAALGGISLVQGYLWGSAGPLAKLLSTWARSA
ncbi:EAL domain-containing protein [Aquihabitans sp. McL0605]|uniref:EAL domain-containing protein n=1 Tax=Aquihabitans sp. McL0605 TaxID=3415671 RepID=UPI003CFA6FB9